MFIPSTASKTSRGNSRRLSSEGVQGRFEDDAFGNIVFESETTSVEESLVNTGATWIQF